MRMNEWMQIALLTSGLKYLLWLSRFSEIATLVAKLNESEAVVTKLNQQVTEANEKFESLAKQLTDKEEKLTNFSKEYDDLVSFWGIYLISYCC